MIKIQLSLVLLMNLAIIAQVAGGDGKRGLSGIFGSVDVLEKGVPALHELPKLDCRRSTSEGACKECCLKIGYQKHKFVRPFSTENFRQNKLKAFRSTCTCYRVLYN